MGKQLSLTRTTLRLFDDLLQLNRTLSYGLGSGERDIIVQLTTLLSNAINTFYYPMEHIALFSDLGVFKTASAPFWKIVSCCWASTTYLAIVRYLIGLFYGNCQPFFEKTVSRLRTVRTVSMLIQHRRHKIKEGTNLTTTDAGKFKLGMAQELLTLFQQVNSIGNFNKCNSYDIFIIIVFIQLSDFGLAINSIPGLLWGGKLKPRHTGLLGIISTAITLAKMLKLLP